MKTSDIEKMDTYYDPTLEEAPSSEVLMDIWNKITELEDTIGEKMSLLESKNPLFGREAVRVQIKRLRERVKELDEQLPEF